MASSTTGSSPLALHREKPKILQNDITKEKTQAVVVFRSEDRSAEGESLRVLQAAGDLKHKFVDEYETAKAEIIVNDVNKGVVLTSAGNLAHQQHILHLHISEDIPKFRETIFTALRLAEKKEFNSVAFPLLPPEFDTKERRDILQETFTEFADVDHPIFLHFIQLSHCADLFREYIVHDNLSSAKSKTSSPSQTDQAGCKNNCVLTHDLTSSRTESSTLQSEVCNKPDTEKDSKRIESIDAYMSIEKNKSKQVHVQALEGNIVTQNTQAAVAFRSQDGIAKGDSLELLQAAGDSIKNEYQLVKAEGGRNVARGVVLTGAGNLTHQQHILHLHISDNIPRFRETIFTALRLAEKKELKSISFPSMPQEFDTKERRYILLEIFREFTEADRPVCLHFIQQVTSHDYKYLKNVFVALRHSSSCSWVHFAHE